MTLKKFQVGERALLTKETFQHILNSSKSIHAYPSHSFVELVRKYIGQSCAVTHTFTGYDVTVRFDDDQHFHFKGHWIQEIKA